MTGLPHLLGRGFLIGFVLPATIFLLTLKAIDDAFHTAILSIPKDSDILGIAIVPFAILFIAILLMAINRPIVRTLEGYGRGNPFRLLLTGKTRKFMNEIKPVLEEKKRLDETRKKDPTARSADENFSERLLMAVTYYPDEAEFILPTKFGNIMRAMEVYPRVVYEIECIQAWTRLQLILPGGVKDQLKDSRAMLDLVVNLIFLSNCMLLIYLGAAIRTKELPLLIAPTGALITICLAWAYLPVAAAQWGETVKSVFDVYRGALARSLGLTLPKEPLEEVAMWDQVSRMMIYRSREAFLASAKYRNTKIAKRSEKGK